MKGSTRIPRILAISSGGGHWIQLLRLRPVFIGSHVLYASVGTQRARDVAPAPYYSIPDANRQNKAMPGYFAVRIGRMLGARTLFLDSIANAEELSLSANLARRHCDLVLTQWPHLAEENGPRFSGSVL
jgi:hypothetical protein